MLLVILALLPAANVIAFRLVPGRMGRARYAVIGSFRREDVTARPAGPLFPMLTIGDGLASLPMTCAAAGACLSGEEE